MFNKHKCRKNCFKHKNLNLDNKFYSNKFKVYVINVK